LDFLKATERITHETNGHICCVGVERVPYELGKRFDRIARPGNFFKMILPG
jgi:hypothetical protein